MNYHFFWGEEDPFSNFYPVKYYHPKHGHLMYNSEQDYMWHKAMFFGDIDIAEKIIQMTNPIHIKHAGRLVKGFEDTKWDKVKYEIMYEVCWLKFAVHKNLRQYILDTEDSFIVEASPYDRIWGIGYYKSDALEVPMSNWGKNLLGQVLMQVRRNLGGR